MHLPINEDPKTKEEILTEILSYINDKINYMEMMSENEPYSSKTYCKDGIMKPEQVAFSYYGGIIWLAAVRNFIQEIEPLYLTQTNQQ